MRKRVISLVLVSSISISLLSGCGKNSDELTMDDYIALYNQDEALIEQQRSEIDELKVALSAYGYEVTEDEENSNFSMYELAPDGSVDSYMSVNNKIAFKDNIEYEGSYEGSNNTSINLSDNIKIKPSSNWTVKVNGSHTELSHDKGIACSIDVTDNTIQDYDPVDLKTDVLNDFFKKIGCKTTKYSTLYVNGYEYGYEGQSTIKVKRKVEVPVESVSSGDVDTGTVSGTAIDNTVSGAGIVSGSGLTSETVSGADINSNGTKIEKRNVEVTVIAGIMVVDTSVLRYRITYDKTDDISMKELAQTLIRSITFDGVNVAYE